MNYFKAKKYIYQNFITCIVLFLNTVSKESDKVNKQF